MSWIDAPQITKLLDLLSPITENTAVPMEIMIDTVDMIDRLITLFIICYSFRYFLHFGIEVISLFKAAIVFWILSAVMIT